MCSKWLAGERDWPLTRRFTLTPALSLRERVKLSPA